MGFAVVSVAGTDLPPQLAVSAAASVTIQFARFMRRSYARGPRPCNVDWLTVLYAVHVVRSSGRAAVVVQRDVCSERDCGQDANRLSMVDHEGDRIRLVAQPVEDIVE